MSIEMTEGDVDLQLAGLQIKYLNCLYEFNKELSTPKASRIQFRINDECRRHQVYIFPKQK